MQPHQSSSESKADSSFSLWFAVPSSTWVTNLPRPLRVTLPPVLALLFLSLILGGIASAKPAALPASTLLQPPVATIISQVTTPTLAYELAGLTGERPVTVAGSLYTITTRNTYHSGPISMATRYAFEQLAAHNLVVTYHNYVWTDRYGYRHDRRNVVAEKPGLVNPDEIYLIAAHVDNLPEDGRAPGADDNGSGSIAVLTAARLLAPRYFAHTIRFVLFTGEEQGLRGSAAYAADCQSRGDDVRGVVNLDMIGYNSDANRAIDIYTQPPVTGSLELTYLFSDVVGAYGLNLAPYYGGPDWPVRASDQWSFLQRGYPAVLVIEDMDDFTPAYHRVTDTLSTLDLDYYADATRAAIATIAHLGCLLPTDGPGRLSGTVYDLNTAHPLSNATVAALWTAAPYTFTTLTGAGGIYSLSLPAGRYTLTARSVSGGYYPATISGVLITTGTTAVIVQDIALAPWPRLYLPCVVRRP